MITFFTGPNNYDGLKKAHAALSGDYADRTAYDVVQRGQEWARQDAPKDTTALAQSVSIQTNYLNDYQLNIEMSQQLNPRGEFFFEPNFDGQPGHGVLLIGAGYGQWVNEGTINTPQQPFWDRTMFALQAMFVSIAEKNWRDMQ